MTQLCLKKVTGVYLTMVYYSSLVFKRLTLIVSETLYICEDYEGTISCAHKPGTVINIAYANYGRTTGGETCPTSYMYNQYCYAPNSTLIVKNQCESKVSCTILANNTVFGDPCVTTDKYLEVRLHCIAKGILARCI